MRLLNTVISALSLLLLIFAVFFWARSHWRYGGILHFTESTPVAVTASNEGKSVQEQFTGRSSGLISYKGQLTYVSIVNPLRPAPWESWSSPADATTGSGPMALVADARVHRGLRGGAASTQSELRDPVLNISWRLPYHYFTAPYWLLAIVLGVLPVRWVIGYREAVRREREGLCARCGGDVKGLSGNCPKCGAPIS
ncbi:MAG TPA: hypothetical protein VH475_20255 [Tepidisphaeraceae bacterium]|jgi:hypothetical protein